MLVVEALGSSEDDCVVRVFLTLRLIGVDSTGVPAASLTVIETGTVDAPRACAETEVGVSVKGAALEDWKDWDGATEVCSSWLSDAHAV